MTPEEAEKFIEDRHQGVVATIKKSDGWPHLTNIAYAVRDGRVRISVTDDRVKVANLRADPRVALHVTAEDFWHYAVAEGTAELSPVSSEPGDEVTQELLEIYEDIRGEPHPDPEEFHQAMVDDRRLVLSFPIEHIYYNPPD
jgi:PPOX class probable F420-dependent enzyme